MRAQADAARSRLTCRTPGRSFEPSKIPDVTQGQVKPDNSKARLNGGGEAQPAPSSPPQWRLERLVPSHQKVHDTIPVPLGLGFWRKLLAFSGPGVNIALICKGQAASRVPRSSQPS